MKNSMKKLRFNMIAGIIGMMVASASSFGMTSEERTIENQASDLNVKVLETGLKAFYHAKEQGLVHKDVLTLVDYSKPSSEKRLWVIDLAKKVVLFDTYVAHGKDSGENYADHFSNKPNSYSSSVGVYVTGSTYQGKNGYSLHLHGLEKGFNDNAYGRAIVMHAANYVSQSFLRTHGRLGRSWGCPAVSPQDAPGIIGEIKEGSVMVAYYPDQNWLSHSQYV
jgi:hypothetical protein